MGYRKKLLKIAQMMNLMSDKKFTLIKPVIDCFETAITEAEADVLIEVGVIGTFHTELKSKLKYNDVEFENIIAGLAGKGIVWIDYNKNERYYNLAPILPGWFEVYLMSPQIDETQKIFLKKLESLLSLSQKLNVQPLRYLYNLNAKTDEKVEPNYSILTADSQNSKRRIVINKDVKQQENEVILSSTARNLIQRLENDYPIALVQCFCRVLSKNRGNNCSFQMPDEACIVAGNLALQIEEFGIGRRIGKEEAIEVINKCQDKGAIHTAFHERDNVDNPVFAICNCCWDCCVMYGGLNRGGLVSLKYKSYYIAKTKDDRKCISCGVCQKFCPTEAIKVGTLGPLINEQRCIGCGQCALKCATNAINMEAKERNVIILNHSKKIREI